MKKKCRERTFSCVLCKKKCKTMAEITRHIRNDHPDFKYSCSKCPKVFVMQNGRYKHEMLHKGLKYYCDTCDKPFIWNCELRDHERIHTTNRAKRITCHISRCKKDYSSKHALKCHIKDDHDPCPQITCDFKDEQGLVCGKKSKSLTLHKQHYTHTHKGGFLTLCGMRVPWPNDRQKHQRECTACKKIKAKR